MPIRPRINKRKILATSPNDMIYGWRLREEVRSVLQNGVGRYVPQLARFSLFFCQRKPDSAHVREYIRRDLAEFALKNPCTSVYVIPKLDKSPYVIAEYLNGREVRMPLGRLTYEELQQWIEHIRLRSGRRVAKFDNYVHTDRPSVQGIWHPFRNAPTSTIITSIEDAAPLMTYDIGTTATDAVRRLSERLQNVRLVNEESDKVEVKT